MNEPSSSNAAKNQNISKENSPALEETRKMEQQYVQTKTSHLQEKPKRERSGYPSQL